MGPTASPTVKIVNLLNLRVGVGSHFPLLEGKAGQRTSAPRSDKKIKKDKAKKKI